MRKALYLLIYCCLLLAPGAFARTYTEQEGRSAWNALKRLPIDEKNFRLACDLLQDIAQTNIQLSYAILAEYLPMVQQTGNRQWIHILLMGWAKAKESFAFFDTADSLYRAARANATYGTRPFDEAIVGTVLLYSEWGRADSVAKYSAIGEKSCRENGDRENESFIWTFRGVLNNADTAFMRRSLDSALRLAANLPDKNALFTALYNRATIYSQFNPQEQVNELETLLQLSKDSTLSHRPRLYERTAFYFRNPGPSVYYQLMQVNMLLTDYNSASRYGDMLYDAVVKPNPTGPQAPYIIVELALAKASQGDFSAAAAYLAQSRALFHLPIDQIPNSAFYLASGLLAEHAGQNDSALYYLDLAVKKGSTYGSHYMQPSVYYAHALILAHRLPEAAQALATLAPLVKTRMYTAIGYYYYQYQAALLKATGNGAGYGAALDSFYRVKDSLLNLNHYRVIQEVNTRFKVREEEQQLLRVNEERAFESAANRRRTIYLIISICLLAVTILLLLAWARNLRLRKQQAEQRHQLGNMEAAMRAEENERARIAGELHDEVGALLSLASLNISSALEKGGTDPRSAEKLEKAQGIVSGISGTIRNLSHQLTPPVIEKYGFRKAVEEMAATINLAEKIKLETIIIGFEDTSKYSVSFLNALYRMTMELVHNVLKHAQATTALLELVEHGDTISLLVEDNGVGIKNNPVMVTKGKGIDTMKSKIAYLNGKMETTRKKEGGTLVVIEIPA